MSINAPFEVWITHYLCALFMMMIVCIEMVSDHMMDTAQILISVLVSGYMRDEAQIAELLEGEKGNIML